MREPEIGSQGKAELRASLARDLPTVPSPTATIASRQGWFCPKCTAKSQPVKLSLKQFETLRGELRKQVAARFDMTYHCPACGALFILAGNPAPPPIADETTVVVSADEGQ